MKLVFIDAFDLIVSGLTTDSWKPNMNSMSSFEKWQVIVQIIQSIILLATFLAALYIGLKQNEINNNTLSLTAKQTEINQKLFELNYRVSIELTYGNKQFNVFNKSSTILHLWGTRLNNGEKSIEKSPRIIAPNGFYYILLSESLETEMLQKIGQNGERMMPLDLFLENDLHEKYIANTLLYVKISTGVIAIHTQTLSIIKSDWSS